MRIILRVFVVLLVMLNSACAVNTEKKPGLVSDGVKPTPQNETVFQDWRKKCQLNKNNHQVCLIYQNITIKGSGKSLLYASFTYKNNKLLGSFKVPFGVFLPAGVALKVDEKEQVNFVVQTCLADGCYSSLQIEDDLLDQFKTGSEAKVGFKTIDQRQLAVKLSLKGFSQAINSLSDRK